MFHWAEHSQYIFRFDVLYALQAKLLKGKSAGRFQEDGKIYLVKGLPFPWNKKEVGRFKLKLAESKTNVNMRVG